MLTQPGDSRCGFARRPRTVCRIASDDRHAGQHERRRHHDPRAEWFVRDQHTERQLPSDSLPDMARSFVGDHLTIIEVLDWSSPGPDGSRSSLVDIHIKGAPLTLKGTVRLEPSGSKTLEVIEAQLKANVPLIGGRLERAAADPINAAIRIEIELLREWLAR